MKKLLFLLLFIPLFSIGQFTQVNTSTQASGSTATLNITVTATTQNNLVVVHIKLASTSRTVNSVTDNVGNTYVVGSNLDNGSTNRLYQAYGVQVTGGATTITVNLSSSTNIRAGADEYSGGKTTNATVFDATQTGTGNSTSLSTATLTNASTGELIVSTGGLTTAANWTQGSGYTLYNGTGSVTLRSQYKLSGASTETAPCTIDGSAQAWTEIVRSYIPNTVAPTNKGSMFKP